MAEPEAVFDALESYRDDLKRMERVIERREANQQRRLQSAAQQEQRRRKLGRLADTIEDIERNAKRTEQITRRLAAAQGIAPAPPSSNGHGNEDGAGNWMAAALSDSSDP